jgi:multiple sugar transport system permease protein
MQPRDIEDAARLDGAGEWSLFWQVSLPLAKPAVTAVAVLAFMDQWRNFLWPLMVTHSPRMEVAEVALAHFHADYASNVPYQMAAAVLVTIPLFVVCLLASRSVVAGVRFTGADARL